MNRVFAVIAAGGSGTRMNAGGNKIFLPVGERSALERSIRLFEGLADCMVIVCKTSEQEKVLQIVQRAGVSFPVLFAAGGMTRQESVLSGLRAIGGEALPDDIVLVHDAARCLTDRRIIRDVIQSCIGFGSGVAGIPAANTMKYADSEGIVTYTVERTGLFEIQTPQGFRFQALYEAYLRAEKEHFSATDDASVAEYAGIPVHLVPGSRTNIKMTEKEDLAVMEAVIRNNFPLYRTGIGYDVHRLTENRRLILCGVEIPYPLGLLGHSDADVGLHALMDAMLGAVSRGDIGRLFPDTSEEYKGISSLILLDRTYHIVQSEGYELANADITIVAQKPKLSPYIPAMIAAVAGTLKCDPGLLNIKATTTEKLGFEGREEGISAQAVCMMKRSG